MAECDKIGTCAFISTQLGAMPAFAEMLKNRYCLGDCSECARHMLAQKGVAVPFDLFPDDHERAKQLLSKAS